MLLVEHGSVARAAAECGIARQTLYKWMREPEFASALRRASGEQVETVSRRLSALMLRAVDELERLIDSGSEHQRRLAAEAVLSHGIRLRELTELEQRIANLEFRLGANR
jgi:transposase-like protein